ncbi:MAG: TonB-dependent receptor [Opitutaceae bacterium]|nr:TonB-dependent receptor [Opitutaceae bacterium]
MHFRTHLLSFFSVGATCALAQTSEPTRTTRSPGSLNDPVAHLDTLVVTGALDLKTAFDLAQGVAVFDETELRRRRAHSLGETLSGTTGVSSTYYGPGASRPIIRGMGGDRVRMLSDGVGTLDLSNLSPDHAVAVEPSLAKRIEVLRGPACLLYGNSAVGGVVNVLDGRIPLDATGYTGLAEGRYDSVNDGLTGLFDVEAVSGGAAFKAQGIRTHTSDLSIPGSPDPEATEFSGRLAGSAIDAISGSVGSAWRGDVFSAGVALNHQDSFYGVPNGEEPIAIDLLQRRADFEARLKPKSGPFSSVTFRAAASRYRHHERDTETGEIHTTFRQSGGEGRVEFQQAKNGAWSGVSGVQWTQARVTSEGEEVVTPPLRVSNGAVFTLQEWALEKVTLQAGARVERQRIRLGDVPDGLPEFEGYEAVSGETRSGTVPSVSVGAVVYPDKDTSLALSLSANSRMPLAQELFSNGPHGGTGIYEVGRTDLGREKSVGVEVTLRRRAGAVTGSLGVFAHRFSNYITEHRLPDELTPTDNNDEGLPAYQFAGSRALFLGAEAEVAFHLIDLERESLHLEFGADVVRAEDETADVPLPRITPARVRAEIAYERGPWYTTVGATQVFRQTRVAPEEETETAGYLLLGAEIGRRWNVKKGRIEGFVRGQNLADRFARVHTSFLKESAPLPGRSVTVGLRYAF